MRGEGPLVIEYGDYQCPYCAQADALLAELPVRRVFRHFPVVSKHPRARVLAAAAEAAALQGAFWEFHDSLYADQGRLDDPHLWDRVRRLGLDLDRFEEDRRSDAVAERVQRDFSSGIRAGVTTTPTLFVDGEPHAGVPDSALLARLGAEPPPGAPRRVRDTRRSMPRENVDVVRTMWAAYARGDFEASLAAYSEDTVWDDTRYRPDGAVHRGRDALVEVVRTWRGAWDDYEIEAEDVLDAGDDRVAVVLRETGRGKGGGVEITNRWGQVTTLREGRIVHTMVYPAPEDALQAAGLRPS